MSGNPTRDRESVHSRLGSLFGGESSPRPSLSDHSNQASPKKANVDLQNSNTAVEGGSSTMSRSSSLAKQARQLPVVRWPATPASSRTIDSYGHRRTPSDSAAGVNLRPSNSLSAAGGRRSEEIPFRQKFSVEESEDASHQAALRQAISDEVFKLQRPQEARMAAHHRDDAASIASSRRSARPPSLVGRASRSSVPTAGLTRLYASPQSTSLSPQPSIVSSPTSYSRPSLGLGTTAGGLLGFGGFGTSNNPPNRTSLDSLRSLTARDRGIQTSSAQSMSPVASGLNRWWFQDGNKETVDQMLKEEDKASTAQKEAEGIRKKYLTPNNPIVFCHGLLGFDSVNLGATFAPLQITHWRGIKEVLEENGVEVLITRVPATSGVDERAKVLEDKIAKTYPGRQVHLIGHSMGGLDIRYLASRIRPTAFKILSVTTIASPHRGSFFADYFLETLGKARIPSLVSFLEYLPNGGGDGKAFEGLTIESMKRFNEEVPDVEDIQYFSWGATFSPGLVDAFKWSHGVILEKEGPNDGLVSVSSAQWGKYLGTLEDVNHLDLVGWVNTARYKWAELTGKSISFKPASFYLDVAATLAKEVEGLKDDDDDDSGSSSESGSDGEDEIERPAAAASKGKQRPGLETPKGTIGGGVD